MQDSREIVSEEEEVKHRYFGFMVHKNLSSGSVSQAQVDELWRYLSAESREFAESVEKLNDAKETKEAKEARVAAALAAKGAKGDPKGGRPDPKAKGDPKGGPGGGTPRGGKGGGRNDNTIVEYCRFFDSDNGCRFGADCA